MIIDHIDHCDSYKGLGEAFDKAFAFLKSIPGDGLPCGRHEIDGDRVYAVVSSYETVPASEKMMEAHRRYIDVQYVISGREAIGYAPLAGLKTEKEYDPENDFLLVKCDSDRFMEALPGTFLVLYPQDGHRPGCLLGKPEQMHKVVVKIALDQSK